MSLLDDMEFIKSLLVDIDSIEISAAKKFNWYYHAFNFDEKIFSDMITSGLKCRRLLFGKTNPLGYNGPYYISLSKELRQSRYGESSYLTYRYYPRFIIDNIRAIKCNNAFISEDFSETFLPFRHSTYNDEYQKFWKIEPSKFVGLQYSIQDLVAKNQIGALNVLRKMILLLKESDVDLPIYDYSNDDENQVHLIDKDKYLILCKEYHIADKKSKNN